MIICKNIFPNNPLQLVAVHYFKHQRNDLPPNISGLGPCIDTQKTLRHLLELLVMPIQRHCFVLHHRKLRHEFVAFFAPQKVAFAHVMRATYQNSMYYHPTFSIFLLAVTSPFNFKDIAVKDYTTLWTPLYTRQHWCALPT